MLRKTTFEIITGLLVLLFVYASVSKLLEFGSFKFQLGRSPFTAPYAAILVWAIPSIELIISGLLIFNKTRIIGLYIAFLMMVMFTAYIYAILHFSYYVPCSCGGIIAHLSWEQHLIFNLVFTAIALTGIIIDGKVLNPALQLDRSDQ